MCIRDRLGILHHLAKGVTTTVSDQALDAIREVGPGGHYLGCAHTQANFKEAFWRTDVLDYKPFETWEEEGARDSMRLASLKVEQMLANYQQPSLSPDIAEALATYVANKKSSMPDSFI